MTGRPLETAGPAPLGSRRSKATGPPPPREARSARTQCFLAVCRVPVSGPPIGPETPLASFHRLCAVPQSKPWSNAATAVAKRYIQAKSVVLGMSGQTRPASLDGGRYGFDTVVDHVPVDHWTIEGAFAAARIAYHIGHIGRADREDYANYDPEKHAHSSPFLPRAVPQDSEWFPETRTHTSFCFRLRSSPARHFRVGSQY